MFSMFGRTGAPTKMGPPHEKAMSVYSLLTIFRQRLGASPPDPHWGSTPGHRWGTPDPLVPPLAKIPAGARGGPHIFSEQGPGLSKSGADHTYVK